MAVSQSISLTQGTQSIENNTTQVTFKWTSTQTGTSWNGYTRTAYYYVSINGGSETKYSVSYTLPKTTTKTIVNTTLTVPHNNDGTGSISIRTWMDTDISAGVIQKSTSLALTTIPRASKIDSFTGTDLAGSFSVGYTSYHGGFTNKLRISIPNVKALETFNYTSETEFKLSQASLTYLYSYTSNTDKVQLGAVIETWNGSTKIGESSELINVCYVPSDIKPKIGAITLDPVNITTADGASQDILVKGKNKITISVSGCEPGAGSSIKSYTFTVLSGSTTIETTTTTNTSASLGPFSHADNFKVRLTVTDNRGRTASNVGSELPIECYDYEAPYFYSFNAYRANEDGSENVNGTYLKCNYELKYSPVNSTNNVSVIVNYGGKTSNSTLINLNENSATYQVYLTVIDNYHGLNKSSVVTVFGQSRIVNITSDGTGIAIGKMAESNELLECRWPAKFNDNCSISGNLTVGSSIQGSPPTSGITVHDTRNADITPDSFGDRNANFYFDQIDNRWMSILHMKGWTGDYAAWELAGNAHNSSGDNTLKYRQGIGETWGDWQTVITNKNINNYVDQGSYLPLGGGTLNGSVSLPHQYFYIDGKYGLNCNNSDIINANGIYFTDITDSAGEGINFVGATSGKWDTIYTDGGKLKFHPDRSLGGSFDGQIIYTSSNFRCGTCTLSSSSDTTINFTSAFNNVPTVMLTPLTSVSGVVAGKVKSVTASGFTAIIGGSTVSSAKFVYFAIL